MTSIPIYRGRFAPSPTGPLHFGSLAAAVASYAAAKHHHGAWLVRMEDLDAPRCVSGAADDILRTLEGFGLCWDEEIIFQSQRTAAYEAALQKLQDMGAIYPCTCTRREIADSALHGIDGLIYPGTCRSKVKRPASLPQAGEGSAERAFAWRVRTDIPVRPEFAEGQGGCYTVSPNGAGVAFDDALQGRITQRLESEIGDFVVKRADGLFAYQLAVVVDDAFQGVTHVVRGADLLASTPRQIYLQRLLGLHTPHYMHLPIAVNEAGEKLSKQTLAAPVNRSDPSDTLWRVLAFLRQRPPDGLRGEAVEKILQWAVANWQPENLRGIKTIPVQAGTP